MSFSAIAATVNVSKSTSSNLYYQAVKNAAAANAQAAPDGLLAEINNEFEQRHLEAIEGEGSKHRGQREGSGPLSMH